MYTSMSSRNFGNWIEAYLEYTRYSESPLEFHFWTAISVIAGALRRRVWIDERHFQWTPNFYITFVAPPGVVAKSTSINIGMNLLREIEEIKFGPQVITWQALTTSLAAALADVPYGELDELGMPKYIKMSCLTCAVDELGTFLNPADKELVDALTSLWDSKIGVWSKVTKTQGDDNIINPWINVIACTTPAWIHNHFTEDLIGGGLASRTLFVYAEEKRRFVAYPSKQVTGDDYDELAGKLVEDLRQISDMVGEYVLSPEATKWGVQWYERHWKSIPKHLSGDRYGGYLARKQTHIHKTAIVLAAAESNRLIIERKHLVDADNYVTQLETAMNKVFQKVGESSTSKHTALMLNFLQAYGELEENRLWYNCMSQMSGRDFKQAVSDGVTAGIFTVAQRNGKRFLSKTEGIE